MLLVPVFGFFMSLLDTTIANRFADTAEIVRSAGDHRIPA